MKNRFFIPCEHIQGGNVFFPKHVSYQLDKVLRMTVGDQVIIFDGSGMEYSVSMEQINRSKCVGRVLDNSMVDREASLNIHLYQALIKPDRYEYVLQKGVEIGVSSFTPFICTRSEMREISSNRVRRWESIITESAEQSGRARVPVLNDILTFSEALGEASGMILIPWEDEQQLGIKDVFKTISPEDISEVSIFIGPVGGFTVNEIEEAKEKSSVSVSLGNRILRSETAGIVASAVILYEFGDMNISYERTVENR
ncbi:MAG TPA: 16S rRNA (uracil(1498)-N(3))-methyltransferase [Dehalococcoidia bacterium]|nr:16S rRNA (uracil(1498)-N(3))-methyltransferase [Dehalococcoidia bacterium]